MVEDERLKAQLARQRQWYVEPWRYLLTGKVLPHHEGSSPRALDVGCGPGLVMESLADLLDVQGVDIDPSMVRACLGRGLRASLADAMDLPFEDGSFDLVYCSFLLVWVDRPERAVQEMLRVSRDWVACLAEPDYAARIDHPPELSRLTSLIVEGARRQGGDPCLGRKLRSIFSALGANAEIGVHQGTWPLERLRQESAAEWEWMEGMIGDAAEEGELAELRVVWERALQEGSLLQCNPTFHALARKGAPLR